MFDPSMTSESLFERPQEHPECLMEADGISRQPLEAPKRSQMRESLTPAQRNAVPSGAELPLQKYTIGGLGRDIGS